MSNSAFNPRAKQSAQFCADQQVVGTGLSVNRHSTLTPDWHARVNGKHDHSMAVLLLAPLPTDDDDDEEILSKNNSSTILRFSLMGDGNTDKCRILTGGDAEVAPPPAALPLRTYGAACGHLYSGIQVLLDGLPDPCRIGP